MNKNFKGIIIEESLENCDILKGINIIETKIEKVTENHKTPWIKNWTMHTIEIPEDRAEEFANQLSNSLDLEHVWYADFKNEIFHYIIFRDKIFKVDRTKKSQYDEVTKYGIFLGIPAQQLDYSPQVK